MNSPTNYIHVSDWGQTGLSATHSKGFSFAKGGTMINTSEVQPGDYWSNETKNGKTFKNYGDSGGISSIPFSSMLKAVKYRICGDRTPEGGYEAFHKRWYTTCDPVKVLSNMKSEEANMPITSLGKSSEESAPSLLSSEPLGHADSVGKDVIFWLGHASQLLCLTEAGVNILFDPIFSPRCFSSSWLGPKRLFPPPLSIEDLPRIDFVLISHNHYDHLDAASLKKLYKRFPEILFVVPLKVDKLVASLGIPTTSISSLNWWQEISIRVKCSPEGEHAASQELQIRIAATPAHHYGQRFLFDRYETLWCGWCVGWRLAASSQDWCCNVGSRFSVSEPLPATAYLPPAESKEIEAYSCKWDWTAVKTYYFTGDTSFHRELFEQIHHHYPRIDMAGLPVGAYEPREMLRYVHVSPADSVEIFEIMKIKQAFGLHWATFELGMEGFDSPPRDLEAALVEKKCLLGKEGEEQGCGPKPFRLIKTGSYLVF